MALGMTTFGVMTPDEPTIEGGLDIRAPDDESALISQCHISFL